MRTMYQLRGARSREALGMIAQVLPPYWHRSDHKRIVFLSNPVNGNLSSVQAHVVGFGVRLYEEIAPQTWRYIA